MEQDNDNPDDVEVGRFGTPGNREMIAHAPADLAAFVEENRVKAAGWKGGTAR
jgi:hypothetical protein